MDATEIANNTASDGYSPHPDKADTFVFVPDVPANFDFGSIPVELAAISGLKPFPIRLCNGKHFGNTGGYGIAHMLTQHAASFALWDYYSVQDFVLHVAQGFDALHADQNGRFAIVRRKEPTLPVDRVLILELRRNCYSVVTGWFVSARRPNRHWVLMAERIQKNGKMTWECRAPHS